MKTVRTYGQEAVRNGVPVAFFGTPFLINEDGNFEPSFSEYFLARRNGDYNPSVRSGVFAELHGYRALQCSLTYLKTKAYQLDTFRRWCRTRDLDPCKITANQLERFAVWTERGNNKKCGPLEPATVNQILGTVIDYLGYSVESGRRKSLDIPYRILTVSHRNASKPWAQTSTSRELPHYIVKRRVHPRDVLVWYGEWQIQEFISEIPDSHIRLGAQIAYGCGLRLAELLAVTIKTFPTPEQWRKARSNQFITVTGKNGRTRKVEVSLKLVSAVASFKSFERKINVRLSGCSSQRLLVGPKGALGRRTFQRAIKATAASLKMPHLSPHILRHHYAAHFLLQGWQKKAHQSYDIQVATNLLSHELIRLQLNLGHADPGTTSQYLYAIGYLVGGDYSDELQQEISAHE